jgi:hypothetical protein
LIITIIAIGVLFIGNYYNYIWIGKRFFKSFLSGFTIAISARTKILPLTLINQNNLGYNIENTPNYQHTISNAAAGLHDDGKTGGILNSWGQYAKSDDIIFDVAGGLVFSIL